MMERSCPSSANLSSSSSSTSTVTITADDRSTPAAGNPCGQGGCGSSIGNSKTSNSNNVQSSLRSLNRASYKISKPVQRNAAAAAAAVPEPNTVAAPAAAAAQPLAPPGPPAGTSVGSGGGAPPYQPQPPVYNIDKNDFRDVVQKLTGSSAHHQSRPPPAEAPPPVPPPAAAAAAAAAAGIAAPTSRLHRIRPPPLAHLSPRPPALVPAPPLPAVDPWTRPPLSPLPPLPTVSAAAESPISAYMRRLRSGGGLAPSPTAAPVLPPSSSPLGFGCLLSPRTAYQMMMTAPALGLPTSPGVQLPSPRLGDS